MNKIRIKSENWTIFLVTTSKPRENTADMPKENNYTDPELRDEVKNEVQQGDKGGKPGQWSARKVVPLLSLQSMN
jgi:hypothetical protein